jgi:hypothetical protein
MNTPPNADSNELFREAKVKVEQTAAMLESDIRELLKACNRSAGAGNAGLWLLVKAWLAPVSDIRQACESLPDDL